jgi:HEAT repeat protein
MTSPRIQGIRALAVWGTAAEVPYLLRLLDDADRGVQEAAIVALGKLKDARAADMLAARLNTAQRAVAGEALKEIGPAAESAVREQLHSADNGARIEAIKILKVIRPRFFFPVSATSSLGFPELPPLALVSFLGSR